MSTRIDDLIALVGLGCFLSGVYLWLGLAASLIVSGLVLIYIGARLPIVPKRSKSNEPD